MATKVYQIAALLDALVEAVETARATAANNARWTTALNTGFDWLLQQDVITFDVQAHELTVNSPSGRTYHANGICQCEAFQQHQACWHRAAARLVRRALEQRLHEVEALADEMWNDATNGTWYDARQQAGAQLDDLLTFATTWNANASAQRAAVEAQHAGTAVRIARAQAAVMELFS